MKFPFAHLTENPVEVLVNGVYLVLEPKEDNSHPTPTVHSPNEPLPTPALSEKTSGEEKNKRPSSPKDTAGQTKEGLVDKLVESLKQRVQRSISIYGDALTTYYYV